MMRRLGFALLIVLVAVAPTLFPSGTPAQTGGGVVVFNGLLFTPLGGASASPDTGSGGSTTPCCLTVSNIGSSGLDGVCMEPGPSQGAWAELSDLPDPDTTTAVVIIGALTTIGTNLDAQVGSMTLTNASGTKTAETDWSFIGSLARRVEVWNNGMPVAQFSGVVGPVGIGDMPLKVGMAVDGMIQPLPDPVLPASTPEPLRPYADAHFSAGTVFSIGVPPVLVSGDELRVFPENPTSYPTNLSRMEVRFQVDRSMAPATVRITDAAMRHFGRMHRGWGDVVLKVDSTSTTNGELNITIPNTNGVGSVSFSIGPDNLGPAPGATADEDCLIWDIKDGCSGMEDEFGLYGILASAPGVDTCLARITALNDGLQWLCTPDYSPIGSATELLLYSSAGLEVLSVPLFTGAYAVAGMEMPAELGAAHNGTITLVQCFASDRAITVPGHGTFLASRVELAGPMDPTAVESYTHLSRRLANTDGGSLGVKVEKSEFKYAELNHVVPAGVRTTDNAFATPGHDYLVFHSDNDPLAPGNNGLIVFSGEDLLTGSLAGGVSWVPLGPAGSPGSAEIDFVEVAGGGTESAPEGMGVRLVSNGSGADVFIDPGLSGITEVEVIVRDAQGSVKVKFPWFNFSQPVLTLPSFPTAAGMHRLNRGVKRSTWLDLGYEADVLIVGPTTSAVAHAKGNHNGGSSGMQPVSSPLTKAELIEILYEPPPAPGPGPDFGIRAEGVAAIVFTDEVPNPTGILYTPRAYTTMHLPYPNPFNPQTTLSFELRQAGKVSLRIYNIEGRYVTTLYAGALGTGPHAFTWDGRNRGGQSVASGVYFAELNAPDGVHHARLNLLK